MTTRKVVAELAFDPANLVLIPATGEFDLADVAAMQDVTATPHPTKPAGGVVLASTWPTQVQLAASLPWAPQAKLRAAMAAEIARRMTTTPVTSARELRPGCAPRDYQSAGAGVIAATGKGLIFDDPGTGKTLTALLGLLACRDRGMLPPAAPILVVCPNSVIDSWVNEVHRWTTLSAVAWRGPISKRRRLAGTADVYVVGYATAANDLDAHCANGHPLLDLRAQALVIDECHWIKTPSAIRSQSVRRAAAKIPIVIALSGTPITHNALDLWPTLYAADAASWPSRERFLRRYLTTMAGDYEDVVVGLNEREPELRLCLLGTYRSLRKADVLTQLPPKVYTVRTVEIPPKYRKAYDDMESDMLAEMDNGEQLGVMTALAQLTRLIQLASSACDVTTEQLDEIDEETGQNKVAVHVAPRMPSWKVDTLLDILAERPDAQTLVFAPSAQLIRVATAQVEKAGYTTGLIIGGQSAAERSAHVDEFQAGKRQVMLATTQAGGVGLTLTAASTVVFLQRPWSYVEASQAEDRAHRIGSEIHESIEIIDVVATGTIEGRIRSVLRDKAKSLAELLEDPRIYTEVLGGQK